MKQVRRLRLEKGWNQNELAFHADLAPSVISQIETGKREPSATTLRKLATALQVEIPDLFDGPGSPKKVKAPPSSAEAPGGCRYLTEEPREAVLDYAEALERLARWARFTVAESGDASEGELLRVRALLEDELVMGGRLYHEIINADEKPPEPAALAAYVRALDPGLLSAFAAVEGALDALRQGADVPLEARATKIANLFGIRRAG